MPNNGRQISVTSVAAVSAER